MFELGGGAQGGPGPGFPFVMFVNMHVFRRTGTSFTPETALSQPGNYIHRIPLTSKYNIYALDWYVGGGLYMCGTGWGRVMYGWLPCGWLPPMTCGREGTRGSWGL